MKLRFPCEHCGKTIIESADNSGSYVNCQECNNKVQVPPPSLSEGSSLAGFRILKILGKGGMGTVYLAERETDAYKVALKVLPQQNDENLSKIDRFLHEMDMSRKLLHPNIVPAISAGQEHGYYYLAMEYIEGKTIDEILKEKESALDEDFSLQIALQMANALKYAYDNFHILHRDVKPSNIMIKEDGHAMLMDMGIAKSMLEDSNLTAAGKLVGTPHYISPEQAKGDGGQLDHRADMYSLGATLYHMLSGERPFKGNTVVEILTKHVVEPLKSPQKYNENISEACNRLIKIMMSKNKRDRYEDWNSLILDIENVINGESPTNAAGMNEVPEVISLKKKAMMTVPERKIKEPEAPKVNLPPPPKFNKKKSVPPPPPPQAGANNNAMNLPDKIKEVDVKEKKDKKRREQKQRNKDDKKKSLIRLVKVVITTLIFGSVAILALKIAINKFAPDYYAGKVYNSESENKLNKEEKHKVEVVLDQVSKHILDGHFNDAVLLLKRSHEKDNAKINLVLNNCRNYLARLSNLNTDIINTFKNDIDKEISVSMGSGPKVVKIKGTLNDIVIAETSKGKELQIKFNDLNGYEIHKRSLKVNLYSTGNRSLIRIYTSHLDKKQDAALKACKEIRQENLREALEKALK